MAKTKPESNGLIKSTLGYFPQEKELAKLMEDMAPRMQEIFIDCYKSLMLMNHNNKFVLPLIRAYAMEMWRYEVLTEEGNEETIKENDKGNEQINPLLVHASRHLTKAFMIAKELGLTTKSRLQIDPGPMPENPTQNKGADEFKNPK